MKIIISGNLVGTFQNETGFFARFVPDGGDEVDLPISPQDYHGLILREAVLTLEVKS